MMLRIILDTNIYGFLIKEKNIDDLNKKLKENKDLKIFGYKVIKEELRDVPKKQKLGDHKLRTLLINLYSDLIKEQYGRSTEIKKLAEEYYKEFKRLGGKRAFGDLKNDFEIVACASIHDLDIIISDDEKTLKGRIALRCYENINLKNHLKVPNFYGYEDLKKKIIGL